MVSAPFSASAQRPMRIDLSLPRERVLLDSHSERRAGHSIDGRTLDKFRRFFGLYGHGVEAPIRLGIGRFGRFFGETRSSENDRSIADFSAKLGSDLCTSVSNDPTRGNTSLSALNRGTAPHGRCKHRVRGFARTRTACASAGRSRTRLRPSSREGVLREDHKARGPAPEPREQRQLAASGSASNVDGSSFGCRKCGTHPLRRAS